MGVLCGTTWLGKIRASAPMVRSLSCGSKSIALSSFIVEEEVAQMRVR